MTNTKLARPTAVLMALFVVFLWATSWVLIKIGLERLPPLSFAGLRYSIGFMLLLPVFLRRQGFASLRNISRRTWVKLLILGVLFYAVTQGASFIALAYLPAVTVNLLWSFSVIVVALLGIGFLEEHLSRAQWLGILLTILGAWVYFYPATFPAYAELGLLAATIGIVANGISSVMGRDVNRRAEVEPLTVTVVSMGIGSLLLLIAGFMTGGIPKISLQSWAIIGWLAAVNTAFAFTLWNRTLQTLGATESSIINGTMMIWIPILAVVFLKETLDLKEVLGLIAVGMGAIIVQWRRSER